MEYTYNLKNMGVKGLSKLIKDYGIDIDIRDLRDSKIAIDVSIFLYKFKYQSTEEQFLNRFSNQINLFRKYDIVPIYIFDGTPPKEKMKVIEQRRSIRGNENTIKITKEDVENVKNLFCKEKITFITALTEAEKMCAYLNFTNKVDSIISNDSDALVFGCKKLITYNGFNKYTEYYLEDILTQYNLTFENFIDICISSGTDYHSGLYRIGLKRAMNLVQTKGKIENWEVKIPEDMNLKRIRELFTDFEKYDVFVDLFLKEL